jgi:8-oxo-dGTP pyrophosphatase MutT (NUDIX family)
VTHKVLVYLMRHCCGQAQVLVFEHRDAPEAGIQVPAGSMLAGEAPEAAAYRELLEESGLSRDQVRLARKLAEAVEPENHCRRHAFLFEPHEALPHRWSHAVTGEGEDKGMVFEFYWLPASPALRLAGAQERYLRLGGLLDRAEQ